MRPARCNLRDAACGILCRRPQHRPHGYSSVGTRNRVHLNNSIKHESEIAGNSIVPLVEEKVKISYIQHGAACGTRPAACGKV